MIRYILSSYIFILLGCSVSELPNNDEAFGEDSQGDEIYSEGEGSTLGDPPEPKMPEEGFPCTSDGNCITRLGKNQIWEDYDGKFPFTTKGECPHKLYSWSCFAPSEVYVFSDLPECSYCPDANPLHPENLPTDEEILSYEICWEKGSDTIAARGDDKGIIPQSYLVTSIEDVQLQTICDINHLRTPCFYGAICSNFMDGCSCHCTQNGNCWDFPPQPTVCAGDPFLEGPEHFSTCYVR